jgi:hypothetical protein
MNTSWLHIIGIGLPLRRHLPKCNKAAVKSGRKQSQQPLVDGWRGSCPVPEKNAIKSSITLAKECRMGSNFVFFFLSAYLHFCTFSIGIGDVRET